MDFNKDTIYQQVLQTVVNFTFDDKTVSVFPDMINRSVPGYATMVSLTGIVANQFIRDNAIVYDLGCSLGASSLSLINHRKHDNFSIIAMDNSQAMIDKCVALHSSNALNENTDTKVPDIDWQCQDVLEAELQKADVVLLNLVLQFIAPDLRASLIKKIYDALNPGGVLMISEKIRHEDDTHNDYVDNWQQYFKKQNGYSELEVTQKRQAIEKTMLIDTESAHIKRFKDAGFSQVIKIYQALNFCGWCVIK